MVLLYLLGDPVILAIPLLIQILSYVRILKKMNRKAVMGIIPPLGELEMTHDLFRRMRVFWRPFIIAVALLLTAMYIGMDTDYGFILEIVALTVYGVFLIRLYWRLGKQFGRGLIFRLGLILVPVIFLPLLAFGRKAYLGKREFRQEKERGPVATKIRKAGFVLISTLELAALVLGCFYITVMVHPFRPLTEYMMNDTISELSSVTDSDEIVGRDATLGEGFEKTVNAQRTRGYFFPDHSGDSKVVVMEYIIGANLEDARACASVNIAQMKDATAKGEGLEFVVQAGGSKRWFTAGIDDETVGRYVIKGGSLEEAMMLDENLCMTEPDNLTDFIVWTKKNYPADRYMLVLWDHGGGFAAGYGHDDLNDREGDSSAMTASEIISAIKKSDVKFDMIGFDACLMQNIEYANALEPYADFYLASEESEPGTGWFYTAGFGKLAEDPAISTEDLGKSMISSYDQCNRATNDGEPAHEYTLSLVDLTLVKPVYAKIEKLYDKAEAELADNRAVYANISAARSGAYEFGDAEQVDVVSFLTNLKSADYKEVVLSDSEIDDIVKTARTCVVYHNSDSADGINGLAMDFPYSSLYLYSDEHEQLKAVKYKSERKFYDKFCSIMASQRMAQSRKDDSFFGILMAEDYTDEKWYIEGFENYDTNKVFIDIPVTEMEDGYLPQLPKKTWDTILDCQIAAYLVTDDGLMYIGREHFAADDGEGHPLVGLDDRWASINGYLVCYETDEPMVTEEGSIYRGTIRARLNDEEDITIHIEWDPVTDESETDPAGHVMGYSFDEEETSFFTKRGLEHFETGDKIEFLFDFYDEEGELIKTDTYGGKLRVITEDKMTVMDEPFESGTILQYFGVLIDVYQRELITEEIIEQVE